MHHFITTWERNDDIISLSDVGLIKQISRVLRMKEGDQCVIQKQEGDTTVRLIIQLICLEKREIKARVLHEESKNILVEGKKGGVAIAYPNNHQKAELIVQKLTEIGVSNIFFWKAMRSQKSGFSDKRKERLTAIMTEATEQSHRWFVPVLHYNKQLDDIEKTYDLVLVDFDGKKPEELFFDNNSIMMIGPEGGFTQEERERFSDKKIMRLGENVLRMETGAIIAGYILVSRIG